MSLQALLAVAVSAGLPVFPGVDFLNHGYSAIRASPLLGGTDSGWTTASIFDVACPTCFGEQRQFRQFQEADGITIISSSECSCMPVVSVVDDTATYQQESKKIISLSGSIHNIPIVKQVSFSATAEFDKIHEGSVTNYGTFIFAHAECVYMMRRSLEPEVLVLSAEFIDSVKALTSAYTEESKSTFLNFVDSFGTHYPVDMRLGGSATAYNRINQTMLPNMAEYRASVFGDAHACANLLFWLYIGA